MEQAVSLRKWIEVVGKEKLQTFQDFFANQNRIAISLLSMKGEDLLVPSKGCLLCYELKERRNSPCPLEHEIARKKVRANCKLEFFTCNMGLSFFLCPLLSNGKLVGFGYGGAVACENSPLTQETRAKYNIVSMDMQELKQIGRFYASIAALLNVDYVKLYLRDRDETTPSAPVVSDVRLTERENEVVELIRAGRSNKDIGDELCISEKTVKTHVSRILTKLGLNDRTKIVVFYAGQPPQKETWEEGD